MGQRYTKKLITESGREFFGFGFGADKEAVFELVFSTAMVGYQEMLTDPTCTDLGVVMTYPLVGSYGITDEDNETRTPSIAALVVREYNDLPSNFRYTRTLAEMMEDSGIAGIEGLDTRELTRLIRDEGSQRCIITDAATSVEEGVAKIKAAPVLRDAVSRVSCKKRWYSRTADHRYSVVAVDCGIKHNIIRMLNKCGCNVTVVPYDTKAEDILALRPDGVVISNGPGDPRDVQPVVETVKALRGKLPIFGIGLGHQLICLACGAETYKMKLGHSGGNHPVKNLLTGKVEVASQNHAYAVEAASLAGTGLQLTHVNLLDNTVEGVCSDDGSIFAVQYHPESAPGPQDSGYLFEQFVQIMKQGGANHA